jgi:hypothetical protein
LATTAFTI